MRVALVLNPSKGGWERVLDEVTSTASAAGWPDPTVQLTTREETGRAHAAAAVAEGHELVVVGGGDGTVRAVAHGLSGSGVELGIVPIGTANLLAHNLSLPRSIPAAVHLALTGRARPVDLGLAHVDDQAQDLPFVVLAGMGHDAATVAATRPGLKERIGWPAYIAPAAVSALRRPVRVTVRHEGGDPEHLRVWSVLAANCTRVRAGVHIAPGGLVDDGLFDVLEVTVTRPGHWIGVAAKGVLRLPGDVAGLSTRASRELEIVSEEPLHVQLDGDVVGPARRLHVRCLQHALLVRSP
ncbi:diacylglycerol/lipid kinase family protein [Janibacter limosus]|uniref:diacylglycerol/lipid kinase family protein n=1 Tax=Janibacter limosus TaxID=53458 RepID=UPI00082F5D1A|nr:diacylglycerol kinase family protein [Janibacter limosus]